LFSATLSSPSGILGTGIERQFDIPFGAELALREKQIQENYRLVIAVHKWFARRPGTLFRALLLCEFVEGSMRETCFQSHDLNRVRVADPFLGGGTPLLEANRIGCDVIGYDINPMADWIVSQEIEHLDLESYRNAASRIPHWLEKKVGHLPTFEQAYERLKQATAGFNGFTADVLLTAVKSSPLGLILLRTMLGFTPPEWAYIAPSELELRSRKTSGAPWTGRFACLRSLHFPSPQRQRGGFKRSSTRPALCSILRFQKLTRARSTV